MYKDNKDNKPLFSDEFLEELAKDINELYGSHPDKDAEEAQEPFEKNEGTA
ncbi:bacitracin ABC transporter ATP-binding protein [Niallia oryzisoli]|uniref:Bacitracin ABC transporter ATP-binding protein n=1 Tax=Niallia oryzisoli TaxID=1737571 RepID=A0ABZ2C6J4_9BACI